MAKTMILVDNKETDKRKQTKAIATKRKEIERGLKNVETLLARTKEGGDLHGHAKFIPVQKDKEWSLDLETDFPRRKMQDKFESNWKNVQQDETKTVWRYNVIKASDSDDVIARVYSDPLLGSLRGRDTIFQKICQTCVGISKSDVANYLKNVVTHIVRKPVQKHPLTMPILAEKPGDHLQVDITYMTGKTLELANLAEGGNPTEEDVLFLVLFLFLILLFREETLWPTCLFLSMFFQNFVG